MLYKYDMQEINWNLSKYFKLWSITYSIFWVKVPYGGFINALFVYDLQNSTYWLSFRIKAHHIKRGLINICSLSRSFIFCSFTIPIWLHVWRIPIQIFPKFAFSNLNCHYECGWIRHSKPKSWLRRKD